VDSGGYARVGWDPVQLSISIDWRGDPADQSGILALAGPATPGRPVVHQQDEIQGHHVMARRFKASPSAPRVGDLPVFEHTLENGLRALVLPRRQVPIVVCDLYYPVGSFDEPKGKSGLAHFLEHMLFKGTERFPKGQIDQLAFLAGGQANAETGEDCTHFWFIFPSDRWELALQIEADRMSMAHFDPLEVAAERKVIGEERARESESPLARLDQMHQMVSYRNHPYRSPVLGWPEDAAQINGDELRAFYRAHYRPDRAVLVLAGDLDPASALHKIEAHFGSIGRGKPPRTSRSWHEPPQRRRRSFVIVDPEALPRGLFGWHTVPREHADTPALDVLADLVSAGRQARLWQVLVEQSRLATWIEAMHSPARRAGQLFIQVESVSEADPRVIEQRITGILEELAEAGPTDEELLRTRNRLEAAWRWEQEDLAGLAAGIGHAALWGDWRDWQSEHAAALAVDADAIRRVAGRYLIDSNLTVGWSVRRKPPGRVRTLSRERRTSTRSSILSSELEKPNGNMNNGKRADSNAGGTIAPVLAATIEAPRSVARLVDYQPGRSCLSNGLRLIHESRPGTGVVALELHLDAGYLREARPGVACLTSRLLEEGTRSRSGLELAAGIENIGGTIEVAPACVSLRVRAEDLAFALELMAEIIRMPAFPAEALDWTKQRLLAELQADLEDPAIQADLILRKLVYGNHPLGLDPRSSPRDLKRLTRDDVVAHHQRHFAPNFSILVAVGEIELRTLSRLVKTHFGTWAASNEPLPPRPPVPTHQRPRVRRIDHPGGQVHILLGHLGIPRRVPDFEALVVLDHILGTGPGFSDRLGRIIRDELGLVYSIGGGMTDSADLLPGLFRIYAGTRPEEAERVVAAITSQIRAMHDGAFGDDEVERAKRYLTGAYVFEFQTVEQRAERLLDLERLGLSLDEPLRWPERIAAITPHQVRRAARMHLRPDALFRVEYGPLHKGRRKVRGEMA
jgi:zinc protease